MNAIRQTQQLNKRELENATPPSASWHADYRDTAWIYVGGLPLDLSEGDVVTIFSQFGNPTHLNMIRDRETGKSKGFGFLKYEDQRSCDLAVDNLTGADVLGRLLRVDHTRYKKRDDEDEDTHRIDRLEAEAHAKENGKRASDTEESEEERKRRKKRRPTLKDEKEREDKLAIKEQGEEEDPMMDYLVREKRDEDRERRHRHHHRRHGDDDDRGDRHKSHRRRRRDEGDDEEKYSAKDRTERRHKDRPEEGTRRGRRDAEETRSRRRDDTADGSDTDAEARRRRRRSSSHDHRPTRRKHNPDEDYARRDSARERGKRHPED